MNKSFISSLLCVAVLAGCSSDDEKSTSNEGSVIDPVATLDLSRGGYACYDMETSKGTVTLALDETNAPITSAHFKKQVESGYYEDVIFHNIIKDYAIQAGSVTSELENKDSVAEIESEQDNGLLNYRGRIAMVRTFGDYDSARADFFINVSDNPQYNNGNLSDRGGLAVFGGVVKGMDVIDEIERSFVTAKDNLLDIPAENIVINQVSAASCPVASDIITARTTTDIDPTAEIDLTRGQYACYQMTTSMGNIEVALDEKLAPISAANFKSYVDDGFYDGTLFHRVINDFMIQGGGFETGLESKETKSAIYNESVNGLKNYRGRLALARTSAAHSSTSQFFINTVDNHFLDYNHESNGSRGYAVFGSVINGMDVVDNIEQVETEDKGNFEDTPKTEVTIDSITPMACPQ